MRESILIIAEAGVNHNGQLALARRMVEAAANAGADCIKFQTFRSEKLVSRFAQKADYQRQNFSSEDNSQLSMLKKLELTESDHFELKDYCKKCNIVFISTPFDLDSLEFLNTLDLPFWKIPSGEITNLPLLVKIAATGKPVVLSTGMSTMAEIGDGIKVLKQYGSKDITLLHCNTEYPTPYCDVNLNVLASLRSAFGVKVGYSDHTVGIEVPIAAAALGAVVIEKHFTLDKSLPGPDHLASLDPRELKQMVQSIRIIEQVMGSPDKKPTESEKKNIVAARKSLVAACVIHKGEPFTVKNLTSKRPGNGISPMHWFDVLGQISSREYEEDELIER